MKKLAHLVLLLLSFVAVTTVESADQPAGPGLHIRALMHRVNAWQLAHPRMKADDPNWERGT